MVRISNKGLFGKNSIFIITSIVLFSSCYYFGNYTINNFLKTICFGLLGMFSIIYISQKRISKYMLHLFIYIMAVTLTTILSNSASIYTVFTTYSRIMLYSIYIELIFNYNKNIREIILPILKVYTILEIINFLSIIIYPNGFDVGNMYSENWFLGYKNTQIFFHLPCLMFSYIYLNFKEKLSKKYFIINITLITISVYYCKSANTMVIYTLLLIYLLFRRKINKIKAFNIKNYSKIFIISFFMIVIARCQEYFAWLISNILHKNINLSGRTIIWDLINDKIKTAKWFGYGLEKPEVIAYKLGNTAFSHAHNTVLDILYKHGIVGLICFVLLILKPIKKLYSNRQNNIAQFISFIFLLIFIMLLFESREEKLGLYIILIFSYYVNEIIQYCKERVNNYEQS